MPNSTTPWPDGQGPDGLLEPEVVQWANKAATSFRVKLMPPLDAEEAITSFDDKDPAVNALTKPLLFTNPDRELAPGLLTSRGFMQHVRLGMALRKLYEDFLGHLDGPAEEVLYIRSTNYERTIQSVAAMILSLLPKFSSTASMSTFLNIDTFRDESREVMHGVGERFSSHHIASDGSGGEQVSVGGCEASAALASQQRSAFTLDYSVEDKLIALFGSSVRERFITELTDASLARYCHEAVLPCTIASGSKSPPRPGHCMPPLVLGKMMREADRFFCQRFAGSDGGLRATELAMYPFLSEILDSLLVAARGETRRKLHIFSGHDTVIAPVLAALGVYGHSEYCYWPPYASRIAFELWRRKSTNLRPGSDPVQEQFVRVIYNGDDVTALVNGCATAGLGSASSNKVVGAKVLCPLRVFALAVQRLTGGKSHSVACQTNSA